MNIIFWKRIPRTVQIAITLSVSVRIAGLIYTLFFAGGSALDGLFNDSIQQIEFATNLLSGKGFSLFREGIGWIPETYRLPGLSILWAPFLLFGRTGLAVYLFVFSLIAGFGMPYMVWDMGKRLFREPVGNIAAWIMALEPLGILLGLGLLSDVPAVFFSLLFAWLLLRSFDEHSWRYAFGAGFAGGMAYLIRPGSFTLMVAALVLIGAWMIVRRKRNEWFILFAAVIGLFLLPSAWAVRNSFHTGTFTYLGMGWRDLYVNYLASVISVETGEKFHDVKNRLKDDVERFGLKNRYELNDPSKVGAVRDYAIQELSKRPWAIIKMQSLLYISFFTNDGWYSYGMAFGFLPRIVGRVSPTYLLLTQGATGIPAIIQESARQFFIPVIGRLFAVFIFLAFIAGWWRWRKHPQAWLLFAMPWLLATLSSVSGLGVEGRYRMGVAPIMYILAGAAFVSPKKAASHNVRPVPNSDPIS